jgi:cobalt-zinc-cadmium efflux system outer membrane protein
VRSAKHRRRLPLAAALGIGLLQSRAPGAPRAPGDAPLASPLTLAEAVARFRAQGFDLLVADADVEASAGDVAVATAVANPSASAGFLHSFFSDGLFETHNGWQIGLSDSNAIADALAGKRGLRSRVARAALAAAQAHRLDVRRTLELAVKSQFVTTAAAAALLRVAGDILDAADHTYGLNLVRFQRGAISEVDLARTETAKLEAQQGLDSAEQTLEQAKVGLAFLIGQRTPDVRYEIDPAQIRFRVPDALGRATVASLLDAARAARPDLLAQRQQEARAGAAADLARRARFPDLALGVGYQQQGSSSGGPGGTQPIAPPTIQLTLTGTLPVFYLQQGEIRRADADRAAQEALAAKAEAQVVSDVEAAFVAYRASRALVTRMEERLLDRARRTRELTAVQYEKGAASLLEYLDAQRTYSAVNAEYWQDLANYWNAVFQLEAASATELSS